MKFGTGVDKINKLWRSIQSTCQLFSHSFYLKHFTVTQHTYCLKYATYQVHM